MSTITVGAPSTLQVLLIEAETKRRDQLLQSLHRRGLSATCVSSGNEALELLAEKPPELLVVPTKMPDLEAETLLSRLSQLGNAPPFVIVSRGTSEELAVRLIRSGARDYLLDGPNLPDQLASVARRLVTSFVQRRVEEKSAPRMANPELRYQTLADLAPVGVFRASAEGQYQYVNRRWCELTGLSARKARGDGWSRAIHPQDRVFILNQWTQARRARQPFRMQHRFLTPAGQTRWVLGEVVPEFHPTGEVLGWVGSVTDITEQKRAEEELRSARDDLEHRVRERTANLTEANQQLQNEISERRRAEEQRDVSEHRFHLLAENARDVIFRYRFGESPGLEYVSPAVTTLSGYTPDEFYADALLAIRIVHPYDRFRLIDLLRRPEAFQAPLELRWRHRDGRIVWVEQRAVPTVGEDGKLQAVEGIGREITERKRAEAELKDERRFLKQLLDVQERDRQLVAYEIHDGVVQHMTGALMLLESWAARTPPAEGSDRDQFLKALGLMRDTIDEARRLISGLRPLILDEAGIVTAIDYLVNETREKSNIAIEYHYDVHFEDLPPPLENAIFRITQEALTNIARHSKARAAYVHITQQGDALKIHIQDWGVGFDPGTLSPGRYGLKGMRERARLFGGRVDVRSQAGEGTTVTVELPMVLSGSTVP
jgi:PAS domain S-box-containing protein